MYLNLDLLYNTYKYLFPLFYYGDGCNYYAIYSSMTKKSIYLYKSILGHINIYYYYDYITFKVYNAESESIHNMIPCTFAEEYKRKPDHFPKVKPFKLDKEIISFLKSNTRIN